MKLRPTTQTLRVIALWVGVPLLAVILLFVLFDSLIMPAVTRHRSEFTVPTFVGKTELEADSLAHQASLLLEVAGREYSSDKPQGIILVQVPEPGARVKTGRNIKIVVSAGAKVAEIPSVAGLPQEQASLILQKAGFVVGEIFTMRVDSLPAGAAIETIPSQGTILPAGSRVSIAVNRAEQSLLINMPRLVGLPLERARQRIEELGLILDDVKRTKDDRYLPNTVQKQDPEPGEQVARGGRVKLTVTKTD